MSRINDLIRELCQDGVPYKSLGEIAELVRGNGMPKADLIDQGVGAIHYGQIYTRYGAWTTQTLSFVSPEKAVRLAKASPGDIIITNTSENIADVGKAVAWLGEAEIVTGGHATVIKHNHDAKFLSYWFASESFNAQKRKLATGTKVIDISAKLLATVRVPVPPRRVQQEIVAALDEFTHLEADLASELESESNARRAQYDHYRAEVFRRAAAKGSWSTLGGVSARITSGGTPSTAREDYYGGGIPWVRTQEVDFGYITATGKTISEEGMANSSAKWIPANCVIVAMYGATAAKVAMNSIPVTTNQACCNLELDPLLADPRYVFHWVSAQYETLRSLGEGTQSNLNAKKIKGFRIPVPSLDEQTRVAALLDNMLNQFTELTTALPAEREGRRKQYKYYRDRLLTFKELAA